MGFIIVGLIVFNIFTVYKFLFRFFFKDSDAFNESVRYAFTPDIISLFRGEYWKDRTSEFILSMFIFSCIAVTAVEYLIINSIVKLILGLIK